jgi:chemotaxis protein MotB
MKPEGQIEPEIIIKRVKDKHAGGHHGGAWKIAYADFVTAMMAFFMLLWIIGATNEDQRKGIADYFTPTVIQMKNSGGSNGVLGGRSIQSDDGAAPHAGSAKSRPVMTTGGSTSDEGALSNARATTSGKRRAADERRFRMVEKIIVARLAGDPTLQGFKGQIRLVRTNDGLRIELIERADFAMFGSGTSVLSAEAQKLVTIVADAIASTPNELTVRGHTDSLGYARGGGSNWGLSSARADTTRRALVAAGVAENRFRRIEGVADTDPYNPIDRTDPRNRRISITVLNAAVG